MRTVVYKRVESDEELHQILELQHINVKQSLSLNEIKSEGFVSVKHRFDVLKRMNNACPHIIATHNNKVIGYALCMLNAFRNDVPILIPMFDYMDTVLEKRELSRLKYLVMGQVCINKEYRKQGVFRQLYKTLKEELSPDFDAIITEVNSKNRRSSEAHQAIGFEILDEHMEDGEDWELIIWKWK